MYYLKFHIRFTLSCYCILLIVVGAAVIGGDVDTIHQFRMQIAMIQHAAVNWLHSVVTKLLVIKPSDFMHWYGDYISVNTVSVIVSVFTVC